MIKIFIIDSNSSDQRIDKYLKRNFDNLTQSFIEKNFPKKYEFESWQIINSIYDILTIIGISKISSI